MGIDRQEELEAAYGSVEVGLMHEEGGRSMRVYLGWDEPHDFELEAEDAKAEQAAEERREHDWADLEAAARDFVKAYGAAAMLRCVSEVLK
jgi:hypothetical protein